MELSKACDSRNNEILQAKRCNIKNSIIEWEKVFPGIF